MTTGEAARQLGVSRQHIVDLCNEGELAHTFIGAHRRVRRRDVENLAGRAQQMTRDQVRSLLLGYAVAGRLVAEPEAVLTRARGNLGRLKSATGGGSNPWLGQWERLLDGPLIDVLRALTSDSPASRELRQNSPFAGVLSQVERSKVLAHVTRDDPVAV